MIKIISADLKSRIDTCRKDCVSLKDRFDTRLRIDTNIQVKEIKGGVQQTGTFLLVCLYLSSDLFVVDTGRMMNTIKDDMNTIQDEKLGAFELRSSI